MTDYFLALIPQYGLIAVFGTITLACMGVPLPAAILALACGGFAATGDLNLWQVVIVVFCSFYLGDQIAFFIARYRGPELVVWLKTKRRFQKLIAKSELLLQTRGILAVVLTRTILSPAGPCMAYICGATGYRWVEFSAAALLGTLVWTGVYISLGYLFAGQLSEISSLISNFIGIIVAVLGFLGSLFWLRRAWKNRNQ